MSCLAADGLFLRCDRSPTVGVVRTANFVFVVRHSARTSGATPLHGQLGRLSTGQRFRAAANVSGAPCRALQVGACLGPFFHAAHSLYPRTVLTVLLSRDSIDFFGNRANVVHEDFSPQVRSILKKLWEASACHRDNGSSVQLRFDHVFIDKSTEVCFHLRPTTSTTGWLLHIESSSCLPEMTLNTTRPVVECCSLRTPVLETSPVQPRRCWNSCTTFASCSFRFPASGCTPFRSIFTTRTASLHVAYPACALAMTLSANGLQEQCRPPAIGPAIQGLLAEGDGHPCLH
ncbi:hypothetical protein HPB50_024610 [Hyalomma asiaticum]|uniref:Uncharacterized protein n=1 Tax=Hyalomma asiaticum TaxID=266040 RepID=A0ACB7RMZ9_HYAAI|nr:hypothetical protein HPB50_024610 [Hyalomma asiaticum]